MSTDMSMDEMVKEVTQPPAQPRVKRASGIHQRLREKLAKTKVYAKALKFAQDVLSYGTKPKAVVKSLIEQYGLNTRQARQAVRDTKPRKRRSRS